MNRKVSAVLLAASATAAVVIGSRFSTAQDQPATMPAATEPSGTELATTEPATTEPATQGVSTQTSKKVSYGFGYETGKQLSTVPFSVDAAEFRKGLEDALAGTEAKVSEQEMQEAMIVIRTEMQAKQMQELKTAGAKNAKAGADFMAKNKDNPGVKTTPSGLQYVITQEGAGATPKPTDTVQVNYTGTFVDGTKFDSSADNGGPVTFPLDRVIPGWTEGLQLLKVGGKATLIVPPDLAYGLEGSPPVIPPNSTLVFEVELVDIVPGDGQGAPGGMAPDATMPDSTQPDATMPGSPEAAPQPTTMPDESMPQPK